MILLRLKLTNFVIFEDVDLDLSNVTLTSIIGKWHGDTSRSNGSGKTAFFKAIPYALWGETHTKAKTDIIRVGADKCVVDLTVDAKGRKIRTYRAVHRDGTSSAKVWVDGKLSGQKIGDVKEVVEKYLGINKEIFDLIYFFRQDAQFGFVNATAGKRKEHLARVLDLKAIQRCLAVASKRHGGAVTTRHKAAGAVEMLLQQLGAMPDREVLVNSWLAYCDDASALQTAAYSKSLYHDDAVLDLRELEQGLEDYDADTAESIQILHRLEVEFNQKVRDEALLSSDLSANEQAKDQANAALLSIPDPPEIGNRKMSDISDEKDEAARNYALAIGDVARLDHIINSNKRLISDSNTLAGTKCPTCSQVVLVDHVETMVKIANISIEKDVNERANAALRMVTSKQDVDRLSSEFESRTAAQRAVTQVASLRATVDRLGITVAEQKRRLESLAIAKSEIQQRRSDLAAKVNIDNAAERRAILGEQVGQFRANMTMPGSIYPHELQQIARAESRIDQLDAITVQVSKVQQDELAANERVDICAALVEAFGKNGLQAILIENLIGVIQKFANDILAQMQTRFEVILRTQKKIQSGDDRETLDIAVFDNGSERMFETYSGGERTLINLALRLALSRVVSTLHGVQMDSLFLDEILAALDETNRAEAIKVVAFLSKSFRQVFVISHTNEIRDVIGGHILVQRFENHSTVSIEDGIDTETKA